MQVTTQLDTFANTLVSTSIKTLETGNPKHLPTRTGFPSLTNSTRPFKTQIHFIESLEVRQSVSLFSSQYTRFRNIRFNHSDSKTIVFNQAGLIYDIAPHWLRQLPPCVIQPDFAAPEINISYPAFFSRSNLSFSHYVATDLALVLLLTPRLDPTIPILKPWITSWQKELLSFFQITRKVVPMALANNIFDVSLSSAVLVDDLHEYEGLSVARMHAQRLLSSNCQYTLDHTKHVVWIGRSIYEDRHGLPRRVINRKELASYVKRKGFLYVDPTQVSIQAIANEVFNAKLIISESGSNFLNYLLFAQHGVPIIQLTPKGCLSPTWSYYNVNNMQWYYPVADHLFFLEAENDNLNRRIHGSPWNLPSRYDYDKLDALIGELCLC